MVIPRTLVTVAFCSRFLGLQGPRVDPCSHQAYCGLRWRPPGSLGTGCARLPRKPCTPWVAPPTLHQLWFLLLTAFIFQASPSC